jgi:hypothetical protein
LLKGNQAIAENLGMKTFGVKREVASMTDDRPGDYDEAGR